MGGGAFSAVKILIPSLKAIGRGTFTRFRAGRVYRDLRPPGPHEENSGNDEARTSLRGARQT
jgi:hypothetical protein